MKKNHARPRAAAAAADHGEAAGAAADQLDVNTVERWLVGFCPVFCSMYLRVNSLLGVPAEARRSTVLTTQ